MTCSLCVVLIFLQEHTVSWTQKQSRWLSKPDRNYRKVCFIRSDYWNRLKELLEAFEEIMKETRDKQTDLDSRDTSQKRKSKFNGSSSSKKARKSKSIAEE